jgi:tRNA(Arg) A34 adenosine deaminase TadA
MPMSSISPQVDTFLRGARDLVAEPAEPLSAHERFQQLLDHGMRALSAGSYGIAACYVIRGNGTELSLFGHNTLAEEDPHGHAEMNAVRLASKVLRMPDEERSQALRGLVHSGRALIRPVEVAEPTTELFSTLEPCPMCTVNIVNARIGTVTYAADDPLAGALASERLSALAPLWPRTAQEQGLRVHRCQAERPDESGTYVPGSLLEVLVDLFEISRNALDKQLSDHGFFHPYDLLTPAARAAAVASAAATR